MKLSTKHTNSNGSRRLWLAAVLALVPVRGLTACSTEAPTAPVVGSSTKSEGAGSNTNNSSNTSPTTASADLSRSAKVVALQAQLTQLNARKTSILSQMAAAGASDAGAKETDINAKADATAHNGVADGIGAAGAVGGIALSIMTGGTFGAIMGGIGLISSAASLANDASVNAKASSTEAGDKSSSAAAAAVIAGLQKQLDETNTLILQIQAQINAASPINTPRVAAPAS